jgi:hypothetical protein
VLSPSVAEVGRSKTNGTEMVIDVDTVVKVVIGMNSAKVV